MSFYYGGGNPDAVQYDEFGREIRLRSTAANAASSAASAPRRERERSPTRQRRDRSRSPVRRDGHEYEYKRELNRYKDTHLDDEPKAKGKTSEPAKEKKASASSDSGKSKAIELPADLPEEDMMKLLGLPASFDSTHEKHVEGADMSAARVVKQRQARQYMNVVKRSKPGAPANASNSRIKR
jgi:hypothetical protein